MKMKVLSLVILSILIMATQGKRKRMRSRKKYSTKAPTYPTQAPEYPTLASEYPTKAPKLIPKIIQTAACKTIVTEDPESLEDRFKNLNGTLCLRLNETRKEEKLRKYGDYNPRYMAVNRTEASHFDDLSKSAQHLPPNQRPVPPKRLYRNISLTNTRQEDESMSDESTTEACLAKGTAVSDSNLTRMCTECPTTSELPVNVFPQFINEVLCHDTDRACLPSVGQCSQGILKFTLLQMLGEFEYNDVYSIALGVDVYTELWEDFTQDVGASCNCLAFATV